MTKGGNSRRRILYLTPGCFDAGGISRYCRYQIQAARELSNVDIKILSMMGPDGDGFEAPLAVDWHGAPRVTAVWRVRFILMAIWSALTFRPDIIHIAHVNYAPLAVILSRLSGAKTLLNVYGLEIWSGLSDQRSRGARAMDRIIADCHFTANYVVEANLHAVRPVVIWDCVDLQRFAPGRCPPGTIEKYGIPAGEDVFVVLTLGRLAKGAAHKGYDRLIGNFAEFTKAEPNAHLVIAGKGDLRLELEDMAKSLGVAERVKFIGRVGEEDLADVYRSANVFSLVSDRGPGRGEGIPLTPLEAMSCGVPIIVGNHDGSQEAVVDARNGYVIDPFDKLAHVAALAGIAQSKPLADQLARGAREVAVEKFGFEGFKRQLGDVYEGL
jgi:phosphatidylinositol alpha-1,6-mannosyltransferase